jgi:hypothetical protein
MVRAAVKVGAAKADEVVATDGAAVRAVGAEVRAAEAEATAVDLADPGAGGTAPAGAEDPVRRQTNADDET